MNNTKAKGFTYESAFTHPVSLNNSNEIAGELVKSITQAIYQQGFCIIPKALPEDLVRALHSEAIARHSGFSPAGIGRQQSFQQAKSVRNDRIQWITEDTPAGKQWLNWCEALRITVNRQLMLGLFSFESHYAHYPKGHYYQRHKDAFKGNTNRILSLVTYLNPDWPSDGGGELVIFENDDDITGTRVTPELGKLVIFLSEDFPHEVLPAKYDRHSIAGWFRVNDLTGN